MKFDTESWYLRHECWGELDSILIAPRGVEPTLLVTLCHGFGASGTDLVNLAEDIVPRLTDSESKPAFLFPAGLIDLSEEFGGGYARAWWMINMARLAQLNSVESLDELRNETPPGIDDARSAVEECISACLESLGWNSTRLVVGGFSQGAMLSVDLAIRSKLLNPVGLIAWSGALICESVWREAFQEHPRTISAFQSHGRQDTVLPISTGRALNHFLKGLPLPEIGRAHV